MTDAVASPESAHDIAKEPFGFWTAMNSPMLVQNSFWYTIWCMNVGSSWPILFTESSNVFFEYWIQILVPWRIQWSTIPKLFRQCWVTLIDSPLWNLEARKNITGYLVTRKLLHGMHRRKWRFFPLILLHRKQPSTGHMSGPCSGLGTREGEGIDEEDRDRRIVSDSRIVFL